MSGPRPSHVMLLLVLMTFIGGFGFSSAAWGQIASTTSDDGRRMFVNSEPPTTAKSTPNKSANQAIYLPSETSFTGQSRPAMYLDRDGTDRMVREAAERHNVDPALVRAVIETESNWNPTAKSRKGAMGLMQLIPSTAIRFGVNDAFSAKQNVDAGVHYLKTLLERYKGNLDLALAAYNAGEGAVDRAHGVPAYRETRNYVQRVQDAYFRPGSGHMEGAYTYTRRSQIRKEMDINGRIVFTNE